MIVSREKGIEMLRTEIQTAAKMKTMVMLYPEEFDLVLEALDALEKEAVPVASGERWGVEFKQWSLADGRMLTKGWEISRSEADSGFVDEAEALDHIAELREQIRWFTSTTADFRPVRLG